MLTLPHWSERLMNVLLICRHKNTSSHTHVSRNSNSQSIITFSHTPFPRSQLSPKLNHQNLTFNVSLVSLMACRSASVNLAGGWSPISSPTSSMPGTVPPPVSAIVKMLPSPPLGLLLVGEGDDDSSSLDPLLARFDGDDVGWIFLVCTRRGLVVLIPVLSLRKATQHPEDTIPEYRKGFHERHLTEFLLTDRWKSAECTSTLKTKLEYARAHTRPQSH